MNKAAIDWISVGFEWMLSAAFAAAPFALVVFAIDATVGRRMPARFRSLLWTLVAVRMLMPLAPESPFSLERLWIPVLVTAQSTNKSIDLAATPYNDTRAPIAAADNEVNHYLGRTFASPEVVATGIGIDWTELLFSSLSVLWLAGAIVVLLRAVAASSRFGKRLRTLPLVQDESIVGLLSGVCDQLGMLRRPRVKYVADLPAPAVFGIFRPTLCLPESTRGELNSSQLRMIMLHETMHLRRCDGFLAWMLTAVRAAHWWNPIAWLINARITTYREEACDDGVRQHTQLDERRAYVDLLLHFAAARPTANLGLIGIWFARPARRLSARISAFVNGDQHRRHVPWTAAAALGGLLTVAGLTDATNIGSKEAEPQSTGGVASSYGNSPGAATSPICQFVPDDDTNDPDKDEVEERSYDVTRALAKLAEISPHADAEQWLQMYARFSDVDARSFHRDGDCVRFQLRTTRQKHVFFSKMLSAIERSGPWQVTVEAKIFRDTDIDAIGDINWQEALKFPLPPTRKAAMWPASSAGAQSTNNDQLSLSVESVSWEFAPYLALVIDAEKMRRVENQYKRNLDPKSPFVSAPKITLFSGMTANIREETQRPFVVGIDYVKGKLATAAQPEVAVLSEGVRLDVQPIVIDAKKVDLQCMLAVSFIEDVKTTKLPGQEITVQNPRASRKQISARCQLAPGQALLLAQVPPNSDEKKTGFLCFAISANWFPDEAPANLVK